MTQHDRLSQLDVTRKAAICSGRDFWNLEPIPELDLDAVTVTDGPHGLRRSDDRGGIRGLPATCFPTAAGLAASWDRELVQEVGHAIGVEARAQRVAVVLGPGANIKRHPLCGRNFEYFSEDPLLTGEMAAALIRGIQSAGVGTSIKHFAANNQEANRMVVDVVVDERTLREIYLAGFELAIRTAAPWTVMCAYNRINGTYCSEHRWLLTEVLREEWGFEGAVMTDWGAINDRVAGVLAGLDLEMPGSGGINDAEIVAAVASGRLGEADLDVVASRMVDLIERSNAALAEPAVADEDAHHRLARRAAAASAVLLTNDGALPLDPGHDVAVIGAFATAPRYQGAGSSMVTPTRLDNILDAIREMVADPAAVRYAAGYEPDSDARRPDLVDEAVLVARAATTVVVVVGLPANYESEAYDRDHMRMPEQHNELVRAVCAANPNTVVVLCNGSAVQIPWVDRPRAILEAYLGGQGGGQGTADVLYGRVNPSGKLAETFALRQSDHGSDGWFPGTSRQVQYREGIHVGYRWFDAAGLDVLFPFGHGLSYTSFAYRDLSITGDTDADATGFGVTVSMTVTNTGERAGAEVVQVYVRDRTSSVVRPDRELKAFAKVPLEAGASERIEFHLDRRSFAYYDVATAAWQIEAGTFDVLVGSSSRDVRLTGSCDIASRFAPSTVPHSPGSQPPGGRMSAEALTDDRAFAALLGRPIPATEPIRPFHRNSTIGEVSDTKLGAGLRRLMLLGVRRQFPGADPETTRMLERAIDGATLRSTALLTGGKLGWRALDRTIRLMNLVSRRSPDK